MNSRNQSGKKQTSITPFTFRWTLAILMLFIGTACGDEGSGTSDTDSDTTSDTTADTSSTNGADSTAGVDTATIADSATVNDTGTVADSATVNDTGTVADSATVNDTGTIADSATVNDTGTVADSATVNDTGTIADSATVNDTGSAVDTGTGVDTDENYIIADHTAVAAYANIPQQYIDIVKHWLVDAAGESHSAAYRDGMNALAAENSTFAVSTFEGRFPDAATDALRLGRHSSVGEEDFWTNDAAVTTIKDHISAQHTANNPIHVIFQAWCWDMTRTTGATASGSNDYDAAYGCHWFGSSSGGPDGDHIWGLDSSDNAITGNTVSLQTYLDVVDEYNTYASENSIITQAIFSTGPVDGQSATGERGYQRFIKHEAIRAYVKQGGDRFLFDYADILAHNDADNRHMETWTSPFNSVEYTFPAIHPDNDAEETGHIAHTGALRIAKAMWWLLARMAGWDGQ